MSDSKRRTYFSSDTARFKVLLETLPFHFRQASKEQRKALLDFLEDWKYSLRRKDRRKECKVPVDFAFGDKAHSSMTRNISLGGVFIETTNGITKGEQTTVVFKIPSMERPSKIQGEVAWKSNDGFGVAFETTSDIQQEFKAAVDRLPRAKGTSFVLPLP